MSHHHQPTHDALSLLRGHAFSHNRTLDDVADDIVERRLSIQDLIHPPSPDREG